MIRHKRVYAKINLDAISHNLDQLKQNTGEHTSLMAIVKANGYGHGAVPIARSVEMRRDLWGFGVATMEEALQLRASGIKKPILILGYTFEQDYETLAAKDIRPTVFQYEMAEALSAAGARLRKEVPIHIKIDTGMNRVGYRDDALAAEEIQRISRLPYLRLEGVFTHFSKADETDPEYTLWQVQRYQGFLEKCRERGISFELEHCSNSAGIIGRQGTRLDLVRAGIAMYGLYPSEEVDRSRVKLQPALSLHSHIIHVKTVEAGARISYGGTFTAGHSMQVATVPVGYGDGYPRSLSQKGYVLIRGCRAPVLGRICMDQFMVDVTGIAGVQQLDEVILAGEHLPVEELSRISGRFPYEFVCDLGQRIPRVYIKGGEVLDDQL